MTATFRMPTFEEHVVMSGLTDGYWIQAVDVNGDNRPDLVTSGLIDGEISWFENPGWTRRTIARVNRPVGLDAADLTGDGTLDLVVTHDYGQSMWACGPGDGTVSWLRNPGDPDHRGPWERRLVGDLLSAHRVQVGRFRAPDRPELVALPIVGPHGGPEALREPVRVTLYQPPENPLTAPRWPATVVDDAAFHILHDLTTTRHGPAWGPTEKLVVASAEGLSWLGVDDATGRWRHQRIHEGERGQAARTGFTGSNSVAVGRLAGAEVGYLATLEPFHGNTVVTYVPAPDGTWTRHVLDVYADPNEAGEGPGHHVVAADLDNDGEDEFLVALRGPMPWQGVFCYKAVDAARGWWVKTRVSSASAARITVADFDGDGLLDFATIGYYVPGYFLADNPTVSIHRNTGRRPSSDREHTRLRGELIR
ncbi:FG-GAP repeat domain-containing protein [Micromonospora rosaria]|nr:VCBS repeat-containing protein [Micromonospora rosaria]